MVAGGKEDGRELSDPSGLPSLSIPSFVAFRASAPASIKINLYVFPFHAADARRYGSSMGCSSRIVKSFACSLAVSRSSSIRPHTGSSSADRHALTYRSTFISRYRSLSFKACRPRGRARTGRVVSRIKILLIVIRAF